MVDAPCPRTRSEPGICTERTAFEVSTSPRAATLSNHEHHQPDPPDSTPQRWLRPDALAKDTTLPQHLAPHQTHHARWDELIVALELAGSGIWISGVVTSVPSYAPWFGIWIPHG